MVSILSITEVEGGTPMIAKASAGVPVFDRDRIVYPGTVEMMRFYAHLTINAGPWIMSDSSGTIPVRHRHSAIYLEHAELWQVVWAVRHLRRTDGRCNRHFGQRIPPHDGRTDDAPDAVVGHQRQLTAAGGMQILDDIWRPSPGTASAS